MKKLLTLSTAFTLAVGFTSCHNMSRESQTGALIGAGTGAVIGHQSGHGAEGAAIGAAAGALAGDAYSKRDRRHH